jgi:hypothetical protein
MMSIFIDLHQITLQLIKDLMKTNQRLSGVIIRIEGIGYGLCFGGNYGDLQSSSQYFRENKLPLQFTAIESIKKMPAKEIMEKIHAFNDADGLPGIMNYISQLKMAA